jgi:hypothetical protein
MVEDQIVDCTEDCMVVGTAVECDVEDEMRERESNGRVRVVGEAEV